MEYVLNLDVVKKQLREKSFKEISKAFKEADEFKCYIQVQVSRDNEYLLIDKTKDAFFKDIDFSLLLCQIVYQKQFSLLESMDRYYRMNDLIDWKEVLHISFGLIDEEGLKMAWEKIREPYRSMTGYLQERITDLFLEATCPKQIHMIGALIRGASFDRTKIRKVIFQKSERHFLWMYDTKARKIFEEFVHPLDDIPILDSYLEYYHIDKIQVILELVLTRLPKEIILYNIMPYIST